MQERNNTSYPKTKRKLLQENMCLCFIGGKRPKFCDKKQIDKRQRDKKLEQRQQTH